MHPSSESVNAARVRELSAGFSNLEHILTAEGGEHLLPGVQAINRILDAVRRDGAWDDRLDDVRSIYKDLLNGKGLLSDFYIWRDNFDARQQANRHLQELEARLSRLLVGDTTPAGG